MTVATGKTTRQIVALIICWFLASCAPAVNVPHTPVLAPDQTLAPRDSRWEKLSGENQVRLALSAMADIDLRTSGGRQHQRVALLLQLPSLMRMESIPLFGPPDFFLSLNREKLKIFLPGKKEFYQGRPTQENLSHFLPIRLSPTDMVYTLLGLPPPLATGEAIAYRESRDGDKNRLDIFFNNRLIRTLWSDANIERLTDMEIRDAETEQQYLISYENYISLEERAMPQQVTIGSKNGNARIIVQYDDLELFPSGDEGSFDLPIPRGISPTGLDREDLPRE
jgi:outer membrane lipoprotein-sorting protein